MATSDLSSFSNFTCFGVGVVKLTEMFGSEVECDKVCAGGRDWNAWICCATLLREIEGCGSEWEEEEVEDGTGRGRGGFPAGGVFM